MITSVNNKKIKFYNSLKQTKNIKKYKLFLVEGKHLINEANKKGILKEVISTKNDYDNTILVTNNVLEKLTSLTNHSGAIGVCHLIENKINLDGNILILDNIKDPGNLGTILRTASAFNYNNIYLSNNSVNIYNDKVIRASEGAIFKVNFKYTNLEEKLIKLKNNNYKIYSSAFENAIHLNESLKGNKHALIIGSEAKGIRQELISNSDEIIKIQMNENTESLNAAVASSILMHYLGDY